MRVVIRYAVDVTPEMRRAIRRCMGDDDNKPATRQQIKDFYEMYGGTMDDDLMDEYCDRPVQVCDHTEAR